MPLRAKARHEAPVALTKPADPATCAHMLAAVVKHALFMQQQIPCPFDELARELEQEPEEGSSRRPVRRPGGRMRKAVRLVGAAQPLLDHLPSTIHTICEADEQAGGGLVAALLLGSSVAAPRVVYLMRFQPSPAAPGAPPTPSDAPVVRDCSRRLLRALMTQCAELSAVDPGACRVHLIVLAPRSAGLSPALFQPRPGLVLKLKRAHVACIDV